MGHAAAFLAAIEAQPLLVPHIRLHCIVFDNNVHFIWFVICPERTVAPADGAHAFVGWFAKGWEGDADGFAVACYA